jgi:hypothetical protein
MLGTGRKPGTTRKTWNERSTFHLETYSWIMVNLTMTL